MNTVLPALAGSLRGYWRDAQPYQVLTYVVGTALIVVGMAHLLGYLGAGGPWVGPVGWRKPFAFGLSFGMTTVTLGWMATYLPMRRRTGWWLFSALAAANTTEVVWVSVQRARGVASHFNQATLLDALLFIANGLAIAVTAAVVVVLTWRAFTRSQASPSMAVAIRAGLVILLVAMAAGGAMIGNGFAVQAAGGTALTTFGAAGIMKVPHAVGMHAIQVLPGIAWLLAFSSQREASRLRTVQVAAAGYGGLMVVSLLQTFRGLTPWDLGVPTAALLVASVACLLAGGTAALLGLRTTGRAPAPA